MAADSDREHRKYLSSLHTLIMDGGTELLQNLFCQRLDGVALDDFLARELKTIEMLYRQKIITKPQYDLLYHSAYHPPDIKNFDITLIVCLLNNIPALGLDQNYKWKAWPQPVDVSVEADICRIRNFQNEIVLISHTSKVEITDAYFEMKWTEIENVLLRLNSTLPNPISDLKQTIDGYKYSLKDPVREQIIEISNELERMKREMLQINADLFKLKQDSEKKGVKNIEQNLSNTLIYVRDTKQNEDDRKENVTDLKQDIEDLRKEIKDLYDILEKSWEENVENIPQRQQIMIKQRLKNIEQHLRDLKQKHKHTEMEVCKCKVDFEEKDAKTLPHEDISARNKRLEDMFQSKNDMKGRLKILTTRNIEDLLDSCDSEPKYKGGFGDIFVSKTKIPVLNMKIIVKKIKLKDEEEEQTMRSFTNEKLCARSLHFAIVPLLGIREDSENRTFYFLSPYMENGNLNKFIEEDSERLKSKEMPVLHPGRRTRILFQIASAIDFLHTPLRDIRGIIIHRDIKSFNIVLDGAFNARLIDFGLAREMKDGHDETKTTSKYYFSRGYDKETQQHILAKHDDYRCFGVVIRELLTGEKAYVNGRAKEALIKQIPAMIEMKLLDMWKKLIVTPSVFEALITLSTQCIKKQMSSGEILKTLKDVLRSMNAQRWENLNEDEKLSKKCEMCLEYSEKKDVLTHHMLCQNNMKVCVSCMRNSYCNPIHCHSCDATIHPKIGHGWAALLIAGDDENDSVAEMFKEDVDAVFKVITSKCPLVMGVRAENVQIIKPAETMENKKQDAVDALQNVDEIHTLLVYVSSHYKPEDGGFLLKSKPARQFISISELQRIIAKVLAKGENEKRAIVFFDCCYAPDITIAQSPPPDGENIQTATASPTEIGDKHASGTKQTCTNKMENELMLELPCTRIVQMNVCRANQIADMKQGGSLFRKFFIQGLTRNALGEECELCPKDQPCSLQEDFVTVEKLRDYITSHCSSKKYNCVICCHNVAQRDGEIGYVINFRVYLQVTYKYRDKIDQDKIPQNMFGTLSELQIVLFDKYVEKMGLDKQCGDELKLSTTDFYEILCIEVEKGPKNHQRDRLTTLERIIAAWNAKRELVVTLRELNEVTEGPVGIFLPSGQTVEPILGILQDEAITQDEHATTCHIQSHNFERFFEKIKTTQKEKPECSSVKAFSENAVYLANALHNLNKTEKDRLKEIQIIFPCAFVNGARQYRMDFLCYKVVKHEDG